MSKIVCNTRFFTRLRIGSNPADNNRFRSHTGKGLLIFFDDITLPISLSFTNFELYNFGAEREGESRVQFPIEKVCWYWFHLETSIWYLPAWSRDAEIWYLPGPGIQGYDACLVQRSGYDAAIWLSASLCHTPEKVAICVVF